MRRLDHYLIVITTGAHKAKLKAYYVESEAKAAFESEAGKYEANVEWCAVYEKDQFGYYEIEVIADGFHGETWYNEQFQQRWFV